MTSLLLVLTLGSLCAVCVGCWQGIKLRRELRARLREARDEMGRLRIDVKLLLAHAERGDEAARKAREEAHRIDQQVGSFLPDDATAAKLERQHRNSERRFLSSRTPPSPLSTDSGPSVLSTLGGKPSPRL